MKNIAIFEKLNGNESKSFKSEFEKLIGNDFNCFSLENYGEKPDYIVVFGGDGTILKVAPKALELDVPIISVNAGTVGFLSGYEASDLKKCADDIKRNNLFVSERSVLKIETGGRVYTALNDAVIERDRSIEGMTIVSKLDVSIDSQLVYNLSSDGVIISTPTGSTAYSLSAGGAVLTPDLKSFIVTPICSHSLGTRPVVYDDQKKLIVDVCKNSCDCVLSVDGKPVEKLKFSAEVTVSKYEKYLKIIDNNRNFYQKIHNKL